MIELHIIYCIAGLVILAAAIIIIKVKDRRIKSLIEEKNEYWRSWRRQSDICAEIERSYTKQLEVLKEEHKQELEEQAKAPAKSLELTEFLHDVARYGYTYARVRPADVMIRSPRDRN